MKQTMSKIVCLLLNLVLLCVPVAAADSAPREVSLSIYLYDNEAQIPWDGVPADVALDPIVIWQEAVTLTGADVEEFLEVDGATYAFAGFVPVSTETLAETVTIPALDTEDWMLNWGDGLLVAYMRYQPEVAVTATVAEGPYLYTGEAITPAVVVKANGAVVPAAEYDVVYSDNVNAGTASVSITSKDNSDYAFETSAEFTIGKATITITANSFRVTPGSPMPTLAYTVAGLVEGEALTTLPSVACSGNTEAAGSHIITVSGAAASDNYEINYVNGTLTVGFPAAAASGGGRVVRPGTTSSTGEDDTLVLADGTVAEKTQHEDGTVIVTVALPDGSISEFISDSEDNTPQSIIVTTPDGTRLSLGKRYESNRAGDDAAGLAISKEMRAQVTGLSRTDAGGTGQAIIFIAPEDVSQVSVSLPFSEETESAPLTIATSVADISIPAGAMAELQQQGKKLELSLAENADRAYEAQILVDGADKSLFSDKIIVKVSQEGCRPDTVAVQLNEDGTESVISDSWTDVSGKSVYVPVSGSTSFALRESSKSFDDVPATHPRLEAIQASAAHELFKGTGEATFSPDNAASNAMFTTALYRFEQGETGGLNEGQAGQPGEHWGVPAMRWAEEQGIITGDGVFDEAVTLGEAAAMLWKHAGSPAVQTDVGHADNEQYQALVWALEAGLFAELTDEDFGTAIEATEAEPKGDAGAKEERKQESIATPPQSTLYFHVLPDNEDILSFYGALQDNDYSRILEYGAIRREDDSSEAADSLAGTETSNAEITRKKADALAAVMSVTIKRGAAATMLNRYAEQRITRSVTDSTGRIRDTDIAEEMMAYTKNNILTQSAQAMLQQAAMVPQGVLQLLQ